MAVGYKKRAEGGVSLVSLDSSGLGVYDSLL